MTSVSASGIPFVGICNNSKPAFAFNNSAPKCEPLPTPAELNVNFPGCFLASVISSATVLIFKLGETINKAGPVAVIVIASKSFIGSKGNLL